MIIHVQCTRSAGTRMKFFDCHCSYIIAANLICVSLLYYNLILLLHRQIQLKEEGNDEDQKSDIVCAPGPSGGTIQDPIAVDIDDDDDQVSTLF